MLAAEDCVLVLLAAGKSERFGGDRSKLDQDWRGMPLGLYAAVGLAGVPFRERLAVTGGTLDLRYDRHGFTVLPNPDRDRGMASSVRLGIGRAMAVGARSVLIALADMPRITAAHVRRLFEASEDERSVVASSNGNEASPPALFGAAHFGALLAVEGDRGARDLIRSGRQVVATPAELIDIDTVADLDRLRDRGAR